MATTPVSFRADSDLLAAIDAQAKRDGKDRAATLIELVRAGLDSKQGRPVRDENATMLAKIVASLEELRAEVKTPKPVAVEEVLTVLRQLPHDLFEALDERDRERSRDAAEDIQHLRRFLYTAVTNFFRIAYPNHDPKDIQQKIDQAFKP